MATTSTRHREASSELLGRALVAETQVRSLEAQVATLKTANAKANQRVMSLEESLRLVAPGSPVTTACSNCGRAIEDAPSNPYQVEFTKPDAGWPILCDACEGSM